MDKTSGPESTEPRKRPRAPGMARFIVPAAKDAEEPKAADAAPAVTAPADDDGHFVVPTTAAAPVPAPDPETKPKADVEKSSVAVVQRESVAKAASSAAGKKTVYHAGAPASLNVYKRPRVRIIT